MASTFFSFLISLSWSCGRTNHPAGNGTQLSTQQSLAELKSMDSLFP